MPDMLPTTFAVETVLGCNLRCRECAVGSGLVRRRHGMMSYGDYERIAERIRPFSRYLYLHLWGEPMLNPDIIAMIRHASAYTATNISTNGNTLDARKARELITSGVTDIIVSIDGVSQEVYSAYRVKGEVERALASLVMLQRFNAELGTGVSITPQFIAFEHNRHEMALFAAFCRDIGLEPMFKAPYIREGSSLKPSGIQGLERRRSATPRGRIRAMSACPNARNVFTILLDGSVVACCYDHDGVTTFGNIFESDVMDIWNAPHYREFRERIINGDAPDFCVGECLMY
ncbi:MoaA/NifB/PqqE/SkfB family radical SAM enzyme [Desulfobaculum xiamenense]|uniref:MoaA/NifB/PqqE/SkfB family radical SAM enzyme n=1 Tax=Desulfobaculum xiamenense TaxID=995050 RepID=A0A846QEB3_9BACT|nr:radical SAM protein [Desulfobaculum xiamenense]NJB67076.1 MoaA/NifB/PqqE/SkfB family radical SAM enzyme [Desulfobaculum xiamenense]